MIRILVGLALASSSWAAANAATKAATCVACHGEKGVSQNPLWPNLAGQKKEYLIKQLTDFKEGRRKDPLMSAMSATLSKTDIEELADYYSRL